MKEFKNGSVKFDLHELNLLSMYAQETAERYEALGCKKSAEYARELSDKLFKICEKHGLYENC